MRLLIGTVLVTSCGVSAQLGTVSGSLTPAERSSVVTRAADELDRGYVFEETGRKMAARLREQLGAGAYDSLVDPQAFAEALTRDVRTVNADGHLRIVTKGAPAAGGGSGSSNQRAAVEAPQHLDGKVGYLKINGFPSAEEIRPSLDGAMTALADTIALIIDLRTNGGGDPGGAMYLAGFFFSKPTLVAQIYSRQTNTTIDMTTADVAGPRYLGKPVYILTSRRTFSAGEAAAYHLKHVAHAITVGEPSGGGAHRVRPVDLNERFAMSLPFTRPINVVTKGDWEGVGVTPEIPCAADEALDVARRAALKPRAQ